MRMFNDVDLHAFVDGQISAERRDTIAGALKSSPVDAARVELWRRQNLAIKAMFSGPESEPVPLWLTVGQIASARSKPVPLPKRQSPKNPKPAGKAASPETTRMSPRVAAVLAFVLGLGVPLALDRLHVVPRPGVLDSSAQPASAFAARALEAHGLFGTDPDHPVDVLDNPEGALKAWLERRVSFRVAVPDLKSLGWTLRGGRIASGDLGPGALLVYENAAGHRLSLFESRLSRNASLTPSGEPGTMLAWSEDSIGFALIDTSRGRDVERQGERLRDVVLRSSRGA